MTKRQVQQVKQRLSEVIRLAETECPQQVTCSGEPYVWIISDEEFIKLHRKKESLVSFFQRSPSKDVNFLLKEEKISLAATAKSQGFSLITLKPKIFKN